MPEKAQKFDAAMILPFSSAAGRTCIKLVSGIRNRPPQVPVKIKMLNKENNRMAPGKKGVQAAMIRPMPMPKAEKGINLAQLSCDIVLPATNEPTQIPVINETDSRLVVVRVKPNWTRPRVFMIIIVKEPKK